MKKLSLSSLIHLFLFLSLTACSSAVKKMEGPKKITLESKPSGATIYTLKGEKVGVTPLSLQESDLEKITIGDSFNFLVKSPGFIDREVVVASANQSIIELPLTPNSKERFDEMVLNSYPEEINTLSRSLLMVQGLIFLKKYDQAVLKLNQLQIKYPLVAAVYTLLGNIYFNTGKVLEAREQFSRAVSLDPADDSAKRFLNQQK